MATISMSRMKELGLKPPEAIANLEILPAKLGEQLNNMTEEAMKHVNKTKISDKLKGTEKLIEPPPNPKKPAMTGGKDEKNLTILRVPSSPGQELVEELPGVKPLSLPGDEKESSEKNGEKAKPPPAQEGGTDGESGLSIGESGEEGPAEGQDTEDEPVDLPMKQQKLKKIKPKKPKKKKNNKKKKKKKPESKAPEIPPQLKNPDLKAPKMPNRPLPPPSPYYYGIPGYKKHKVGGLKPFSITFDGKQVTNVQPKDSLRKHSDDEDTKLNQNAENAVDKNEGLFISFLYPLRLQPIK